MRYLLYTWLNKIFLEIQLRLWFKEHSIEELEDRLIGLGCKKVVSRDAHIFHTPNGKGRIVITDTDIWINPPLETNDR